MCEKIKRLSASHIVYKPFYFKIKDCLSIDNFYAYQFGHIVQRCPTCNTNNKDRVDIIVSYLGAVLVPFAYGPIGLNANAKVREYDYIITDEFVLIKKEQFYTEDSEFMLRIAVENFYYS